MGQYLRVGTLDQALDLRATGHSWKLLAGATDFYPAYAGRPIDVDVLDLTNIPELCGIEVDHLGVRLGACVRWLDLGIARLPKWLDGLCQAAREIGGHQIQARATIGGNICNASPAADGIPPLISLNASVEIAGPKGIREILLCDFLRGNRKTILKSDEILIAIRIPKHSTTARASFRKLGSRKHLVISIASVGMVAAANSEGILDFVRVAVGACSEVPVRLTKLEDSLTGHRMTELATLDATPYLSVLSPVDDVRADAWYRRDAVATLIRHCGVDICNSAGSS
ncbi:MAG: xanthine dehydrogenase family protein subunit M [Rhodospirillaceae bacterium]|nr:xanthine dehydrogenase family protein subunit M [Rhodospirillaceae bacterium]